MNLTTYITGGLTIALVAVIAWYGVKTKHQEDLIAAHQAYAAVAAKQLKEAEAVTEENMQSVTELLRDIARQKELTAKAERAAQSRDAQLKQALKRIADAPASQDGPVAPVLRHELDGLRTAPVVGQPGAADSDHPDPSNAIPDLDRSDVSAAPPAS